MYTRWVWAPSQRLVRGIDYYNPIPKDYHAPVKWKAEKIIPAKQSDTGQLTAKLWLKTQKLSEEKMTSIDYKDMKR